MKVSEIRIFPVDSSKGRAKAFASITLDNCIAISSIAIYENRDGRICVSYPGVRDKKHPNVFHAQAFPINKETQVALDEVIVAKYKEVVGDAAAPAVMA